MIWWIKIKWFNSLWNKKGRKRGIINHKLIIWYLTRIKLQASYKIR